jgi:hypothetical protein
VLAGADKLLLDKQFADSDLHDLEIALARSRSNPNAVLMLLGLCGHVTPFQAMFRKPRFGGYRLPRYTRATNASSSLSTAAGSINPFDDGSLAADVTRDRVMTDRKSPDHPNLLAGRKERPFALGRHDLGDMHHAVPIFVLPMYFGRLLSVHLPNRPLLI